MRFSVSDHLKINAADELWDRAHNRIKLCDELVEQGTRILDRVELAVLR